MISLLSVAALLALPACRKESKPKEPKKEIKKSVDAQGARVNIKGF